MISSKSGESGKVASAAEERLRTEILLAPERFTAEEIANAGLTNDVRGRKFNKSTYKTRTHPADPRTASKTSDLRTKPEVSG